MTTGKQDWMADRIDRQKDKAQNSARALQVREMAKSEINCAVREMPANDQPEYIRAAIHHLRLMYGQATDEKTAVALFGSLAWSGTIQTRRAIAGAEADQAFAKLTRASNDDGAA